MKHLLAHATAGPRTPERRTRGPAAAGSWPPAPSLALGLGVAACGGSSNESDSGSGEGGSLDLVAYSTPQTATRSRSIPAFNEADGAGIEVSASFGASGDQSRAVEGGQPADLVHLPIEPDITRLVDAGLVAADYTGDRGERRRRPGVGGDVHHPPRQPEGHHRLG